MYIERLTDEQINVLTAYLVADDAKKMKCGFNNFVLVDVKNERNRNRIEIYAVYNDKRIKLHNVKFVVSDFSCLVFDSETKDFKYLTTDAIEEYFPKIFGENYTKDFNNNLYGLLNESIS